MSNLDILLANDRMAWLDREARDIQLRAQARTCATKTATDGTMNGPRRGPYTGSSAAAPRMESLSR